jgi:hypothetical protein
LGGCCELGSGGNRKILRVKHKYFPITIFDKKNPNSFSYSDYTKNKKEKNIEGKIKVHNRKRETRSKE